MIPYDHIFGVHMCVIYDAESAYEMPISPTLSQRTISVRHWHCHNELLLYVTDISSFLGFIYTYYQGFVSLGRIAQFLDLDENKDELSDEGLLNSLPSEVEPTIDAIRVEDGTFSWGADTQILNKLVAPKFRVCVVCLF